MRSDAAHMCLGDGPGASLRKLQKMTKVANTDRRGSCQVDLVGANRREYLQSVTSPRDRDVETALPTLPVHRPEVHRNGAGGIRAISNRKPHVVAFVALDGFQVLHENGLY